MLKFRIDRYINCTYCSCLTKSASKSLEPRGGHSHTAVNMQTELLVPS